MLSVILVTVLCISLLSTGLKNPDKPLKGEWDFKLKRVWMVNSAGGDIFASPRFILISKDCQVCVCDPKNVKCYIFDKNGRFKKAFARKGEGPGEIKSLRRAYIANNTIIIVDIDKIHYFTLEGDVIKEIKNDYYQRPPALFLNENEFIYFPTLKYDDPKAEGQISLLNLDSGDKKVIGKFDIFKGGVARDNQGTTLALVIQALTPVMTIGDGFDRLYYGRNDSYMINVMDYEGRKLDYFSIDRKKKKVSKQAKREYFKNSTFPEHLLESIIKSTPEELTYFNRIEAHKKLVYTFPSYLDRSIKSQQVDIFSPDGQYLYRSFIHAPEGCNIISISIPIFTIKDGNLYIALEDEEGEIWLVKYDISLPNL
jgi:hypothetical protein